MIGVGAPRCGHDHGRLPRPSTRPWRAPCGRSPHPLRVPGRAVRRLVVAAAGGLPGGDLGGQRYRHRHTADRVAASPTADGQQAAGQHPQLSRHRTRLRRVSAGDTGGAVEPVRRRPPSFPHPWTSRPVRRAASRPAVATAIRHRRRGPASAPTRCGWRVRPALLQPRQGQVGGEFAAAVEQRLPRPGQIPGAGELVAEQLPQRCPSQPHPIPALLQEGDESVNVARGDRGLLSSAAQLHPRRHPTSRTAFSISPRLGRGAAVPSGAAPTVNPRPPPTGGSRAERSREGEVRPPALSPGLTALHWRPLVRLVLEDACKSRQPVPISGTAMDGRWLGWVAIAAGVCLITGGLVGATRAYRVTDQPDHLYVVTGDRHRSAHHGCDCGRRPRPRTQEVGPAHPHEHRATTRARRRQSR